MHCILCSSTSMETIQRLDVEAIRSQFPAFARRVHGAPLVYLDSVQQGPALFVRGVGRKNQTVPLNVTDTACIIQVLVENTGRCSWGRAAMVS